MDYQDAFDDCLLSDWLHDTLRNPEAVLNFSTLELFWL
jgi:hypothetical protein